MDKLVLAVAVAVGVVLGFLVGIQTEKLVNERVYTYTIDDTQVDLTKAAMTELMDKGIIVTEDALTYQMKGDN